MSAQHTPGPWWDYTSPHGVRHILPCAVPSLDTVAICTFNGTAQRPAADTDANARLIAAAPEMFAALERVERWLERDCPPELQGVACDVSAALRKAKGGAK